MTEGKQMRSPLVINTHGSLALIYLVSSATQSFAWLISVRCGRFVIRTASILKMYAAMSMKYQSLRSNRYSEWKYLASSDTWIVY